MPIFQSKITSLTNKQISNGMRKHNINSQHQDSTDIRIIRIRIMTDFKASIIKIQRKIVNICETYLKLI